MILQKDCLFGAQATSLVIINVENSCSAHNKNNKIHNKKLIINNNNNKYWPQILKGSFIT